MRLSQFCVRAMVCVGTLLLSGCGGSDTFISFGGKSGGQPAFCISQKANCAKPGAYISSLIVEEVDQEGRGGQTVWWVDSPNSAQNKQYTIVYGAIPIGWIQKIPAQQLVAGRHYAVNKAYYFSITQNGLIISEKGSR